MFGWSQILAVSFGAGGVRVRSYSCLCERYYECVVGDSSDCVQVWGWRVASVMRGFHVCQRGSERCHRGVFGRFQMAEVSFGAGGVEVRSCSRLW